MIGSGLPRRDRAVVAVLVVVLLYGIAVAMWFMGRSEAWGVAKKGYDRVHRQFLAEKKLIAQREKWRERAEKESLKMPVAEEGESTSMRWDRKLGELAQRYSIRLIDDIPRDDREENHGGVWELPIEVKYEASLIRLIEFLYALNDNEGGFMFDVRDLAIKSKNNGVLSGSFTLTCAYMKGNAGTSERK